MAGIEKVCELSGIDCSYEMYGWKRNNIQIHPKYSKNFRNKECVLYIQKKPYELFLKYKGDVWYAPGGMIDMTCKQRERFLSWCIDNFGYKRIPKIINQYTYFLKTDNVELQGVVEGKYVGFTEDLKTVIRKMKRLTRNYKLTIIYVNDINSIDT